MALLLAVKYNFLFSMVRAYFH